MGFPKIPAFPPQRKLAIGRVDDPLEHEADWIAADFMRTSVSATPYVSSDFAARATGGTLRSSKAMALTGPIVTEAPGLVQLPATLRTARSLGYCSRPVGLPVELYM